MAGRVTPPPASPNLRRAPIKPAGQHILLLKTGSISNPFSNKRDKIGN